MRCRRILPFLPWLAATRRSRGTSRGGGSPSGRGEPRSGNLAAVGAFSPAIAVLLALAFLPRRRSAPPSPCFCLIQPPTISRSCHPPGSSIAIRQSACRLRFAQRPMVPAKLSTDQISPHLRDAVIATEDCRFYEHAGVDWRAVVAAAAHDVAARSGRRGASTITMQLFRLRQPAARSLIFKLLQAIHASQLDRQLSKQQILTEYLNRAPFGGNLVGAGAASWRYFGRPCRELSLGQAALLAGIPQNPNGFRPDRFPARAKIRRDHVLDRMRACGMITASQQSLAANEPIDASWHPLPQFDSRFARAPAWTSADALPTPPPATPANPIATAIDPSTQKIAEDLAARRSPRLSPSHIDARQRWSSSTSANRPGA